MRRINVMVTFFWSTHVYPKSYTVKGMLQKMFSVKTLVITSILLTATPAAFAAGSMQTDELVTPPMGFISFCVKNMSTCRVKFDDKKVAALTDRSWQELQSIQTTINQAIKPEADLTTVGVSEQWSLAEKGVGDCEDYALRKKKALIEKGWPPEALLLTTAITETGDQHVVLTVVTDKGDYILDNRFSQVKGWDELAYNWVARQDPLNPLLWRRAHGAPLPENRLARLEESVETATK
jgi:predicted transglutaminase-like cysteine proteinase